MGTELGEPCETGLGCEFRIRTDEFIELADTDKFAIAHKKDPIGMTNSGKSVSDHDPCHPGVEASDGLSYLCLSLTVEGTRRFVHD